MKKVPSLEKERGGEPRLAPNQTLIQIVLRKKNDLPSKLDDQQRAACKGIETTDLIEGRLSSWQGGKKNDS